jgi:hypothetical protein
MGKKIMGNEEEKTIFKITDKVFTRFFRWILTVIISMGTISEVYLLYQGHKSAIFFLTLCCGGLWTSFMMNVLPESGNNEKSIDKDD